MAFFLGLAKVRIMIIKLNQLWRTKIIQYLNVKRTGKNL